jgi:hypothetical protein
MKLDMKVGWRPGFNDKDKLHSKEAIAIKLNYPSNSVLMRTSIRANGNMLKEMYSKNKGTYIFWSLTQPSFRLPVATSTGKKTLEQRIQEQTDLPRIPSLCLD